MTGYGFFAGGGIRKPVPFRAPEQDSQKKYPLARFE